MAARGTVPAAALEKQARAEQHIGGGDMRAAMSALHTAMAEARKVPPCAQTEAFKVSCLCKLAECAKRMKKWNSVISFYTDALQIAPSLVRAYYGRAEAYLLTDAADKAQADLQEALSMCKTSAERENINQMLAALLDRARARQEQLQTELQMAAARGVDVSPEALAAAAREPTMADEANWWQAATWFCFKYGCLTPYRGTKSVCSWILSPCCRSRQLPTTAAKKKRSD